MSIQHNPSHSDTLFLDVHETWQKGVRQLVGVDPQSIGIYWLCFVLKTSIEDNSYKKSLNHE